MGEAAGILEDSPLPRCPPNISAFKMFNQTSKRKAAARELRDNRDDIGRNRKF
jgi:hypothetical protein